MVNKEWLGIGIRFAIVLAIAVASYYGIIFLVPLIYPFLIGWLIAMAIEPGVQFLHRRLRMPRWASVTFLLLLTVSIISSLLVLLISKVVSELTRLASSLPEYLDNFSQYLFDTILSPDSTITGLILTVQEYLQQHPEHQKEIVESIRNNLGSLTEIGTDLITSVIAGIGSFLGNLPFFITVLLFILLAAFFIAIDWPRLRQVLINILPSHISQTGKMIFKDLRRSLIGFVKAQLTLVIVTGIIVLAGLWILGIEYALTIALITCVIDLLPYLGVGSLLIPWGIYLLLVGNYSLGIGILVVYGVVTVVRQLLEPKLVSANIGLNPLLTLIALFVGLQLFGISGLILGPILGVMIITFHRSGVFRDLWSYIKGKPKQNPIE